MNRYINNIINNKKSLNDFDSEIPIKETWQSKESNVKKQNKLALNLILKYYKVSLLNDSCMQSENIEYMILNLIPTKGLIYRSIILKNDWYKNGMGAMIGKMRTGETVVFVPKIVSGYKYINCKTKKNIQRYEKIYRTI
ncbi:hypothetical protein EXQ43_02605 [Clostridium botulinum]|nr:hypothetical protein [Clostridium botulinum]MBO0570404.1 hypothetical protein [Clostridium botulinum]